MRTSRDGAETSGDEGELLAPKARCRAVPYIEHVLGLRQFLLRDLEKVNIEWLWTCLNNNVWKLVQEIRGLRAQK